MIYRLVPLWVKRKNMKHKLVGLGFFLLFLSLVLFILNRSFIPWTSIASQPEWLLIGITLGYLSALSFFAGALILFIKLIVFLVDKVRPSKVQRMKANLTCLLPAIPMFLGLGLPFLSESFYKIVSTFPNLRFDDSLHISFSVYFFGFVGSANGVTRVEVFPYFFNIVFFVLLLISGLIGVLESLVPSKNSKKLMILAGILAIACSPLFFVALGLTLTSMSLTEITNLGGVFSPRVFGLSGDAFSQLHSHDGIGFFWLPPLAGVFAVLSTKIEIKNRNERSPQQT
jgi:hypothetical protein